ncbi:MAG TPA: BrnT family toxin [Thioploca sp.]|nr:MAG: hypothetical protein DRR19_03400 [Gammaproteobacteria bacterium]HDN26836.1 BrnT family toxin [Thioploca sp.]
MSGIRIRLLKTLGCYGCYPFPGIVSVWTSSLLLQDYPIIDEEHSIDEERYITIGLSTYGQLLIVAHTDRQERNRIISARKATKTEAKFYAKSWLL